MNHYEIINEFNEEVKCDYLPKIIDKCLEMEHVENAVFTIIFIAINQYMKTRLGLKPEEYSKEERKYDEFKEKEIV